MQDYQNCRQLSQENQALQARIEELQQTIEGARAYAYAVYNQAMQVMGQHQPRGTWSYYKGRGEMAAELYNMLNVGD